MYNVVILFVYTIYNLLLVFVVTKNVNNILVINLSSYHFNLLFQLISLMKASHYILKNTFMEPKIFLIAKMTRKITMRLDGDNCH